jgi:hypothetical protein
MPEAGQEGTTRGILLGRHVVRSIRVPFGYGRYESILDRGSVIPQTARKRNGTRPVYLDNRGCILKVLDDNLEILRLEGIKQLCNVWRLAEVGVLIERAIRKDVGFQGDAEAIAQKQMLVLYIPNGMHRLFKRNNRSHQVLRNS